MKPEKKVEQKVYSQCCALGISIEIFDSKGTFSANQKRYTTNLGMKNGTPDMIGCDRFGQFVAIELKAPKKENCCSLDQYWYLKKKILSNGFAIVVSCEKKMKEYYETWISLIQSERQKYLLELLPKKVVLKIGKAKKIVDAPPL